MVTDPRVAEARRRWRTAGDRLWPVALSDGESYRVATEVVGVLVEALRERVRSLDELVGVESAPGSFLDGLGAAGARAAAQPELLAAACAVRGDELAVQESRRRKIGLIAQARAAGDEWVELDRSATRVVEMHVATGTALVATADPYSGEEPFRIVETVLDAISGEPSAGAETHELSFSGPDEWDAERERRRHEIAGRLDRHDRDGSDR